MDKQVAIEVQRHALDAVKSLMEAFYACKDHCAPEEVQQIQRGVGLSIGRIETELLSVIYKKFPDLDDLK